MQAVVCADEAAEAVKLRLERSAVPTGSEPALQSIRDGSRIPAEKVSRRDLPRSTPFGQAEGINGGRDPGWQRRFGRHV